MPRDAKTIIALLLSMGITEYEPRVITLLLDFVHSKKKKK